MWYDYLYNMVLNDLCPFLPIRQVRPTSVIGASKRYCELLVNMLSRDEKVVTQIIATH